MPLALPFTRFGRAMQARERLFGVLERLVAKRDREGRADDSVLSTLLRVRDDEGRPLTRDTVVDEVQLLFAGHDTTVTSTSNILPAWAEVLLGPLRPWATWRFRTNRFVTTMAAWWAWWGWAL